MTGKILFTCLLNYFFSYTSCCFLLTDKCIGTWYTQGLNFKCFFIADTVHLMNQLSEFCSSCKVVGKVFLCVDLVVCIFHELKCLSYLYFIRHALEPKLTLFHTVYKCTLFCYKFSVAFLLAQSNTVGWDSDGVFKNII